MDENGANMHIFISKANRRVVKELCDMTVLWGAQSHVLTASGLCFQPLSITMHKDIQRKKP